MSDIAKPAVLKKNSVIGIAAASSAFPREKFDKGICALKSLGFAVRYGDDIYRRDVYLAGSDEKRAAELNQLISDPGIDAIMFARGGYGIQRIMPVIDFSPLAAKPKAIVGYSDLTPILSYLNTHMKIGCFYGPVVTALADCDEITLASLKNALTSASPVNIKSDLKIIKSGGACGPFNGGCLTLLSTSIKTPYELAAGGILFIEDCDEKVYAYDRLLTHLANSGFLRDVKGIVFGSMGLSRDEKISENILWQVVADLLRDFPGPVVCGLPSGHTSPFLTLPLGITCRLEAKKDKARLTFTESALISI